MSILEKMESLNVQVAFAEANAWEPSLAQTTTQKKENQSVTSAACLKKRRAQKLTVVYGIASLALYAVTFMNADEVLHQATMGHFHALIPIATVFLFSYVHGNFAGNLWTALGIEASTRGSCCKPEKKSEIQPGAKKDTRPRATIQA